VDDLVEVAAVGAWARTGHGDHAFQTAVPGCVTAAVHAEHTLAHRDDVQGCAPGRGDLLGGGVLLGGKVLVAGGHASSPFIWWVGVAASAAASTSRRTLSRLLPSGVFLTTCSCSSRIALISISGRGGQPGR